MRIESHRSRATTTHSPSRHGNILPLAAIMMVIIMGFTAFTVDVGLLMETRTQMQSAADSATLAAALEMVDGWGAGKSASDSQVSASGKSAATTVAAQHRVGEQPAALVDGTRDVRFGRRTSNSQGEWFESWGAAPYNMVEVTVRRDQPLSGSTATRGDQEMPLFFANVIGHTKASLISTAS